MPIRIPVPSLKGRTARSAKAPTKRLVITESGPGGHSEPLRTMHPADCIGLSASKAVKAGPVPGASPRRVPRADQRRRATQQQGSFRSADRGAAGAACTTLEWTNCSGPRGPRGPRARHREDDRMPPPCRRRKRAPCRIACTWLGLLVLGLIVFDRRATCLTSNSVDDWVSGSAVVCNGIPGLTKEQRELCHGNPDVTVAALKGLQTAVSECQHQFTWHRWNCSSLTASSRNQQSSVLLQRGYRETAFAYAISAAGVAHSVARACSMGRLISCGCDPSSYKGRQPAKAREGTQWKWGGCSHNLDYGVEFSRQFLDSREKAGDIQSTVNLHNNHAGRMAVASNMQVRCKCHGMSGSCELKTCWKVAPDFRTVGRILKDRFRNAVLVAQSNLGNVTPLTTRARGSRRRRPADRQRQRKQHRGSGRKRKPRDMAKQLFYYQKSPNFCERDATADIPGTAGRRCNRTSPAGDGCASLCCGRGYNVVRRRRTERCRCKFHWCCFVECQSCTVEEWITVCK